MIEVCERVDVICPGCKRPIVDIKFTPHEDGGTVSINHELPPCAWWATPQARQWAVSIIADAITLAPEPSA